MTILVASDCTSITLKSDLLSDYLGNSTNRTLVMESYVDCCTTNTISVTIVAGDITVDEITIDPTIYGSTVYKNGIYYFKLTLTESSGSSESESNCAPLICDLKCLVAAASAEQPTSMIYKYYNSLALMLSCDYCNCEIACTTYKLILSELKTSNSSINVSDCGCS